MMECDAYASSDQVMGGGAIYATIDSKKETEKRKKNNPYKMSIYEDIQ